MVGNVFPAEKSERSSARKHQPRIRSKPTPSRPLICSSPQIPTLGSGESRQTAEVNITPPYRKLSQPPVRDPDHKNLQLMLRVLCSEFERKKAIALILRWISEDASQKSHNNQWFGSQVGFHPSPDYARIGPTCCLSENPQNRRFPDGLWYCKSG